MAAVSPQAARLIALLAACPQRLGLLRALREYGPPGAWIGAGFVRNAVWDHLHGLAPGPLADVDVLYFDARCLQTEADAAFERRLAQACPQVPWSVRNQARMHLRNGDAPYADVADAMRHWPEVCTAVAVRLADQGLELLAPLGLDDLFELRVRPTEHFRNKPEVYRQRLRGKDWTRRWPQLRIELS